MNVGEFDQIAMKVAADCYNLTPATVEPLAGGRVNLTYKVSGQSGAYILQRLGDFFKASQALGDNWLIIQNALAERGAGQRSIMPRLVLTSQRETLARPDYDGGAWRLTEFVPGRVISLGNETAAKSAARLLGRAHRLLNLPRPLDLAPLPGGEFNNQRWNMPEDFTSLYEIYRRHPHLEALKPMIEEGAEAARQMPARPKLQRIFYASELVAHNDPKAANFLFDDDGQAIALIDWDTAALGHPLIDLGELGRSFAVTSEPDDMGRLISADILVAAVSGYFEEAPLLTADEAAWLPTVIRGISLNLARRYLTDALAEVYFHWDKSKYASLREQNTKRARQLLNLAAELLEREFELGRLMTAVAVSPVVD